MKKLLVLGLLLATPVMAQESMQDKPVPSKAAEKADPNTVITLTYGEMAAIIQSAVAEAKAAGAMAKVQSQLVPKK